MAHTLCLVPIADMQSLDIMLGVYAKSVLESRFRAEVTIALRFLWLEFRKIAQDVDTAT